MLRKKRQPSNLRQQVRLESKKNNIIFYSFIIIAFGFVVAALLFSDTGISKYLRLKEAKKNLELEIAEITQKNKTLQSHVSALKTDPFYIEKHAREEYGLAKKDEYIFKFSEDAK